MKLVSGKREQIDTDLPDIKRDFPHRLHRIRMHRQAARACEFRHLAQRLDHSGLVVRRHDGNKRRSLQRRGKRLQFQPAAGTHRHPPHLA